MKARVLVHAIQTEMAAGDVRKAVDLGEALIEATLAADDDYCRVRLGPWLAAAYLQVGDRERAVKTLGIALDASSRIKDPIHIRINEEVRDAFFVSQGAFDQVSGGAAGYDMRGREPLHRWMIETETGTAPAAGPAHSWGAAESIPRRVRLAYAEVIAVAGRNTANSELLDLAQTLLRVEGPDDRALPRESVHRAIANGFLAEADGDRESAGRAYEELTGYAGTMSPVAIIPFDRLLGLLASMLDRHDDAVHHFESALELCRRAEFRPQLAWTLSDYAETLLDRASTDSDRDVEGASVRGSERVGAGDREKAMQLQDEALAISQELGMRPLTERILKRREILRS